MRDGAEIVVRIYTPTKPPEKGSPLIIMYHEGAWSMGDLSDEEVNCRLFAKELGAVCVNVDYRYSLLFESFQERKWLIKLSRLAPEHPFPTGILDCWDALQWVSPLYAFHCHPSPHHLTTINK